MLSNCLAILVQVYCRACDLSAKDEDPVLEKDALQSFRVSAAQCNPMAVWFRGHTPTAPNSVVLSCFGCEDSCALET